MRSPRGGEAIMKWQPGVGIGRNVENREIIDDERISETTEGDCNEDELGLTGRSSNGHPGWLASAGSDHRKDCLRQRQQECSD